MDLNSVYEQFYHVLHNILPTSPFRPYILQLQNWEGLGWLNWLIPVKQIVEVTGYWLFALAVFYGYSILLRWLKVIQG